MAGNTTQQHVYLFWSENGTDMVPVTSADPFPVTVVAQAISGSTPVPVTVVASNKSASITSTTTVQTGSGTLKSVFVSAASGTPTLKISDGSTTLVDTFTPVAGTNYLFPAGFSTSLIVTIGGTVSCTVFWS